MLDTLNHKQSVGERVAQELSCIFCGGTIPPQARFCPHCGALLPSHRKEAVKINTGVSINQPAVPDSLSKEERVKQEQATISVLHFSKETMVLVSTGLVFVVLVVGSYTSPNSAVFAWTGFGGSTLREWLQLLILPLALGLVPLWFATEKEHLRTWFAHWKSVLVAIVMALVLLFVVLEIGTCMWTWKWTGFQLDASSQWGGKFWDWLNLLLLPIMITALPIWFSLRQRQDNEKMIKSYHQPDAQNAECQPLEAAGLCSE